MPIDVGAVGVVNTKISDTPVPGGDISYFSLSPDRTTVVFRGDQDTDNVFELYSVVVATGVVTKISGALVSGGDVNLTQFYFSDDSSMVVYKADQDTDGVDEIYSVPIGGGTVTKLNGTLIGGGYVGDFAISPDSTTVVYEAAQDSSKQEIYSVPIGGGTTTKLNATLVGAGLDVVFNGISADSSTVVFHGDQDVNGEDNVYSVAIGGGTPTRLNGALVSGGDVSDFPIMLSSDGNTVVYRADQDTDEVFELYSAPIGGGTETKLNGSLVSGGDVFTSFQISADDTRVIYVADEDTDGVSELYSVPIGGGTSTKLNGALVSGGNVGTYVISPDSSLVGYRADQDSDEVYELYVVPIAGGSETKVSDTMVSGGDAFNHVFAASSSLVVYSADQDTDGVIELYSAPVTGGSSTKLSGTMVSGGNSSGATISADGNVAIYRADQDTDTEQELYSVPVTGGTVLKRNGPILTGQNVDGFYIVSDDGDTVVYYADLTTFGQHELYRSDVDRIDPTADTITPSTSGPTNANDIDFTVVFNEDVSNFDAAADLVISHSGTSHTSVSFSGSGDTYTVTVEGVSGNGSFTLAVNTGSDVEDAASNALASSVTSAAVSIDNAPPTVAIGTPSATDTNSGPVSFVVTYTGADSVSLTTGDVSLNTSGSATATIGVTNGATSTPTVTLSSIAGDGTLGISIGAATSSDTAGNSDTGAGPSSTFNVDNTAPGVSIGAPSTANTNTGPVTFTVTYTGADSVNLTPGDISLNATGDANGSIGVSNGTTSTPMVTVSSVTGDGTLGINVAGGTASDVAGNAAASAGPSATFGVDNSPPGVDSIVVSGGKAGPINFIVTFQEPVTGVDSGDFALTTTGSVSGASVTGVSGSGTTWTVTVDSGSGSGTIRLDVVDNDSIVDGAGNPLGGPGLGNGNFTTGEVFDTAALLPGSSQWSLFLLVMWVLLLGGLAVPRMRYSNKH